MTELSMLLRLPQTRRAAIARIRKAARAEAGVAPGTARRLGVGLRTLEGWIHRYPEVRRELERAAKAAGGTRGKRWRTDTATAMAAQKVAGQ